MKPKHIKRRPDLHDNSPYNTGQRERDGNISI